MAKLKSVPYIIHITFRNILSMAFKEAKENYKVPFWGWFYVLYCAIVVYKKHNNIKVNYTSNNDELLGYC